MPQDTGGTAPAPTANASLAVWEKAVEVAIHFNDVITTNRRIVSAAVLLLYAASVSPHFHYALPVQLGAWECNLSALAAAGLLFTIFAAVTDHFYYYQLLLGSVAFAERLEAGRPEDLRLISALSQKVPETRARVLSISVYVVLGLIGIVLLFR